MSSFTDPLTVTQLPDGSWVTERDFSYEVGKEGSGEVITVKKGFKTDFFSVPVWARWLIPKSQKGNQAAVLHDDLYSLKGVVEGRIYTRKRCDEIFLEAMTVLEINTLRRQLIYRAVCIGGQAYWDRKKS